MKKYYLLLPMLFVFFVSIGQEVKIIKNKYELVKVSKNEDKIDLTYTPVVYLMKDVELNDENKFTLTQNEYSQLLTELYISLRNKKDNVLKIGDDSINIDYENKFYIFSKNKLGRKLLKNEQQVRFSLKEQEYSVYLTKEDIEKLMV